MFHNLMSGQSGKPKGVAIVLNKSDVASAEDVEKVTGFLRVKELCEEYSKVSLSLSEISTLTFALYKNINTALIPSIISITTFLKINI